MFAQLLSVTVRTLLFRAGPQDFPFDARLLPPVIFIAVVANVMMFGQVMPAPAAAAMSAAMVGGLALVTRSVLRVRQLASRFQQTYIALLSTSALLTLALVPLFAQMAPALRLVAENPKLLETPDKLNLPQGIAFIMNVLNLWSFLVSAWIFRHATNLPFAIGLIIALLAAFSLLFIVAFAGSLAGAAFGAG